MHKNKISCLGTPSSMVRYETRSKTAGRSAELAQVFRSENLLDFGAMEDIRNDKYSARS